MNGDSLPLPADKTFSVLVWCWNDVSAHATPTTPVTRIRVLRLDSGEQVPLKEGSFLLRISTNEDAAVVRCMVRHLPSGEEVHLQSGLALHAFLLSTLLSGDDTLPPPDIDETS